MTPEARILDGVCYGICGGEHRQGSAIAGTHVGACGGAWQTDFDLPITQSCCQPHMSPHTLVTGETACVCPMTATCAGLSEWTPPEVIVIGGDSGWTVRPGNAPFENIEANVGDMLQFTHGSNYHDVTLVDNEDCDFSAGTMVDNTGDLLWTVPGPGTYIFACSRGNHCSSGNQQITVTVGGGSAAAREPEVECVGDVSGDLVVDVIDLLALLGAFGQSGEIAADLDATLLVDVSDLLMLLGEFGSTC